MISRCSGFFTAENFQSIRWLNENTAEVRTGFEPLFFHIQGDFRGQRPFSAGSSKRQTKQRLPERTPAQKALKRVCSKPPTPEIEQQVTHLLGRLAEQPERITQPEKQLPPIHSSTQAELDDVLNTQPLDEDAARSLICKLAQEQYDTIGNEEYETERLRRLFAAFECTAELHAELLQSAVSAVLVTCQTVRLQLKNGQIIGKDDLV